MPPIETADDAARPCAARAGGHIDGIDGAYRTGFMDIAGPLPKIVGTSAATRREARAPPAPDAAAHAAPHHKIEPDRAIESSKVRPAGQETQ